MERNKLMTRRYDLMQLRSDALDKASKAFETGGDKSQYDVQMGLVEGYNKDLEKIEQLIQEEAKSFTPDPMDTQTKGAEKRAEKSGVALLNKVCGTEEYADAWIEALAKGINPDKGMGIESLAPLYTAEKAMKALTIGGGDPIGSEGGFLVPTEFNNSVIALAKDYVDLSTLVTVENVTGQTGWRAVETTGATKLTEVAEMGKITPKSSPKFEKVAYNCRKFADKLPISNELLSDSTALIHYLAAWWTPKFILTKNDLILTALNEVAFAALEGATDAEQIKALKTMINTGLRTATAKRAVILTNASGYNVMDNWVDSTGRPMLVPDLRDGEVQRFKNKKVIYADVDEIPDITESFQYHPLYVGDLKAAVALFIRQGTRIKSTDVGGEAWDTDSTEIRCTCRMDCKQVDKTAVKRTGIKAEV